MKTITAIFLTGVLATMGLPPATARAEEAAPPSGLALFEKVRELSQAGKNVEAEDTARQAVEAMRRESGADHPSYGTALTVLGTVQLMAGHLDEAVASYRQGVPVLEKAMGADNPVAFSQRYNWLMLLRKAGRPAEAAEVAKALRETLKALVVSGRGREWNPAKFRGSDGQPLDLPVFPDENGLANVTGLLGISLAEAGHPDEAYPFLDEARAGLEKFLGVGHPRVVEIQLALEKVAQARGDAIGRRYVGDLGETGRLSFAGNQTFTEAQIRRGLSKDLGFVLATHPAAFFADYLPTIGHAVERGYRSLGFPEVAVEVAFRPDPPDHARILVTIKEGQRVRKGQVEVKGAEPRIADGILAALLQIPKTKGDDDPLLALVDQELAPFEAKRSQAARTKESAGQLVENLNKQLPTAQIGANIATAKAEKQQSMDQILSFPATQPTDDRPEAWWVPGDPVDFTTSIEESARPRIQKALADLGRPMAKWKTNLRSKPDGTADLEVSVESEGPQAVAKEVKVTGTHRNKPERVQELCGLQPGQPVDPDRLGAARLALWNSGRFWPFFITITSRKENAAEVDVMIEVCELDGAPALDARLTPAEELSLRAAREANRCLREESLYLSLEQGAERYEFGCAPRRFMAVRFRRGGDEGDDVIYAIDEHGLRGIVRHGGRTHSFSLAITDLHLIGYLKLMPVTEDSGGSAMENSKLTREREKPDGNKMWTRFGVGFSSKERQFPVTMDMLVAPCFGFLSSGGMKLENGCLEILNAAGQTIAAIDATSGRLCSLQGVPVRFDAAAVDKMKADLEQALAASEKETAVSGWSGLLVEIMASFLDEAGRAKPSVAPGTAAEPGAKRPPPTNIDEFMKARKEEFASFLNPWIGDLSPEKIEAARRLGKRLVGPVIVEPLSLLFPEHDEKVESFTIPFDESAASQSTMALLLGLGYVSAAEEFLPPGTWVAKLSREVLFNLSGNQRYTTRTLNELLADPTVGPYGCLLAAQLVEKMAPAAAREFEEKALRQCTPEGFRQDWKLVLRDGTGLGHAARNFLKSLAEITPAEEADLALFLSPEVMAWAKEFLAGIRAHPVEGNLEDWIGPHLDALWNQHLGPKLKARLEDCLHPPVDAERVAALVDGVPVSRAVVRFMARRMGGRLWGTAEREPGGDAFVLARRDAIRMALMGRWFESKGGKAKPEVIEQGLQANLPESLRKATDEEVVKALGFGLAEARELVRFQMIARFVLSEMIKEVKAPTDDQITIWLKEKGSDFFAERHLHQFKILAMDGQLFHGRSEAVRLAQVVRSWAEQGLSVDLLARTGAIQGEGHVSGRCMNWFGTYGLKPDLREALAGVPEGRMTEPVELSGQVYLLQCAGHRAGMVPDEATARNLAANQLQVEQFRDSFTGFLTRLENQAMIEIIDGPGLDPAAVEAENERLTSALAAEKGPNLIGRLGLFWTRFKKSDAAATDQALDDLLKPPTLDAVGLTMLAKSVEAAGDKPRADRLRQAAEETKKEEGETPGGGP